MCELLLMFSKLCLEFVVGSFCIYMVYPRERRGHGDSEWEEDRSINTL